MTTHRTLTAKAARMDLRVPARKKRNWERAADTAGQSMTDFVTAAVDSAAEQVLAEHERTILTERDRAVFFDALLNPPKPSRRILDAAERYRSLVKR
jgi:uncharacterized protein (DUF1778 family)